MTPYDYNRMETNVCYYASYLRGGYCVIKKTADSETHGFCESLSGGKITTHHFSLFELGGLADPEDIF